MNASLALDALGSTVSRSDGVGCSGIRRLVPIQFRSSFSTETDISRAMFPLRWVSRVKVVLVRVGVDSGSGGVQGPLFADNTFEYVPIPDGSNVDSRKYGNTSDKDHGKHLVEYFPLSRQGEIGEQSIHFDPEFETFTYGDPNTLKARLRLLVQGDLLVFYCGLEGWNFQSDPALYLLAYFEVKVAGRARELGDQAVRQQFAANFHVRHRSVYDQDKGSLVLVKGKQKESRVYERAHCISSLGKDRAGKPLKVLHREIYEYFSDFGGKVSLQRSAPRWVPDKFVDKAAEYVRSLD